MVPSHRKPLKERALSKSNQARPVGKKKRHVKASYASEDEDTTFTPEWNDCSRNITDALRCYKKLRKDKGLRDNLSNQHKMSPEQGRCHSLALDGRVANILKVSGKWVNTIKGIINKYPFPNLTYTGEGENRDQMFEGGNLALKNNIHYKKPVRVISKYNSDDNANVSGYKFVYEGLYRVTKFDKEIESGFSVYKFQLDMLDDHQQYDSKWKQKRIRRH
ncbi:hypothetical protein PVK06_004379 [Gossypium arboreum]|uniref:YDG domain-containing protein n=1 Tax=Gossypium arboreum TaxID=29729 RepID=A0ABR0QRU4_GOSAR|nr:hypothetical protein PVK06_004379 [Gossypium arboreum]